MSANMDKPLIRVENLGKSFGNLKVLEGINVVIHQGDVVFVVGPSGSGKSTFLRCLNRLEYHSHFLAVFINIRLSIQDIFSFKKDFSLCRFFQTV